MTTTTKLAVWERAAIRAEQMAEGKQTWTYGRPQDAVAIWAAGAGMPTHDQYAEPGAIAVIVVEWRRPESFADDDASRGGYHLAVKSGSTRVSAHASVHRTEDGSLRLGRWIDEDGKQCELPRLVRDTVMTEREWR